MIDSAALRPARGVRAPGAVMHPHETLWHGDCVALGVGMTSQVAARLRLSKEIVAEPSARALSRWAIGLYTRRRNDGPRATRSARTCSTSDPGHVLTTKGGSIP